MASARQITDACRGDWHGTFGLIPGPGHSPHDRSLKVMDSERGIIVHSFSPHTTWEEGRDWLKGLGLLNGDVQPEDATPVAKEAEARQKARCRQALEIWRRCRAAAGTAVETYLRSRGIDGEMPPTLRYHQCLRHHPTGLDFPAMVAAVQEEETGRVVAIHRTYLTADGRGKANVSNSKMALAPLGHGAVRLAAAARRMGLVEGIETGRSAMILHRVPVWCALGSRLESVWFPYLVEVVVIFADAGEPGRAAAERAKRKFERQGRRVVIRIPPPGHEDWNDVLVSERG